MTVHTVTVSVAGFLVRPRADLGGVDEIVPTVDGVELLDLIHVFEKEAGMESRDVSYGGLIPSFYRFGPMGQHFSVSDRSKPLLGCDCGEWGCWPLLAAIRKQGDAVMWSEFEQPFRPNRDYTNFGPFVFDRTQYLSALEALEGQLSADPEGHP